MPQELKVKARWEHDEFPAGRENQRGLLIDVTAPRARQEKRAKRPPLNLALVIDRSGSMDGDRLAAAKRAAIGISQQLRKDDRLSIVAYDTELLVLLDGVRQNKAGRAAAEDAIRELHARGCTDLGGGWMRGCKCVADVMERQGMPAGHVILLSDGHANHGLTDPEQLGKHAGELAARGVTSSCVGIGHGYSPLQLNAIAEAGRGQLHHSNDADEIVDVVLGELGEMVKVAAHSARLVLDLPRHARVQQLTRFTEEEAPHRVELDLGDIVAGRTRRVALMVRLDPRVEPGEALPFTVQLSWADSDDNRASVTESFELRAVDPARFDPRAKDREVARVIAELWLARMGYESMMLNERHLYREAVAVFAENDVALETLIAGLEEKEQRRLRERARRTRDRVSDEWSGPSKLMAFSMSRKHMRSESDHSGRNPEDWSDQTGD